MTDFTETFWLTVLGTGAGIVMLIIKKMASSKCDEITCCGIHIHRRVDLEHDDIESKTSDSAKNVL